MYLYTLYIHVYTISRVIQMKLRTVDTFELGCQSIRDEWEIHVSF